MPTDQQIRRAMRLFEGFHEYDVKDSGYFDPKMVIPRFVFVPGPCKEIRYRSNKWGEGLNYYYHPIDSYPHVSIGLLRQHEGKPRRLPEAVYSMDQALIRIGSCVNRPSPKSKAHGSVVITEMDDCEAGVSFPSKSEFFFAPSSRAIFVISGRRHLHGVIWGGKLNVEDRGIVG